MFGATTTEYLKCTNFGFSLPSGSTVNGVKVAINRNSPGFQRRVTDEEVKLVKGGSISGNNKASATGWPSSDATEEYGGSTDLWGLTLSDSDINASGFGAALRAQSSNNAYANVDHVQITVYYTPPATSDILKQTMYYTRQRSK